MRPRGLGSLRGSIWSVRYTSTRSRQGCSTGLGTAGDRGAAEQGITGLSLWACEAEAKQGHGSPEPAASLHVRCRRLAICIVRGLHRDGGAGAAAVLALHLDSMAVGHAVDDRAQKKKRMIKLVRKREADTGRRIKQ